MVRLKASQCNGEQIPYGHFNSTMVRLKVGKDLDWSDEPVFQFHYGTIKRLLCESAKPTVHYFNSTMVRLKGLKAKPFPWIACYFNSTMVRLKETVRTWFREIKKFQFHYGTIKSPSPVSLWPFLSYFNSTMVRLKDIDGLDIPFDSLFQFHYGTIKRKSTNGNIPNFPSISIPLWYD